MRTSILISFLCLELLFNSCGKKNSESNSEEGKKIARVFDSELSITKVLDALPPNTVGKDSVRFVENYIKSWIDQQLVLKKANDNLNEDQKNVEAQLENYRNSLIIYAYEKELISQKLDTIVNTQEIENYYKQNSGNFELKENIIKVVYVKVKNNAPNIKKVKEWFKLKTPNDKKNLENYCHQFAENYFLDEESWLMFNDLLKEIPIKTYNQEQFLQNNRFIEFQDSLFNYFVNIRGFKIKESLSPLGFESQNIKNIIINKRKLKLIEEMRSSLMKEATENKDYEIYK